MGEKIGGKSKNRNSKFETRKEAGIATAPGADGEEVEFHVQVDVN
jgi:hypothetical protein